MSFFKVTSLELDVKNEALRKFVAENSFDTIVDLEDAEHKDLTIEQYYAEWQGMMQGDYDQWLIEIDARYAD